MEKLYLLYCLLMRKQILMVSFARHPEYALQMDMKDILDELIIKEVLKAGFHTTKFTLRTL